MRTGWKLAFFSTTVFLCLGGLALAAPTETHRQKKAKKPELPPIPSGPQGPLQHQMPLDTIPAVPPEVSYQNGQLTIVALNSSLGDILRAVRKQTSAEMEIPTTATERVVTHLGPGPAREIIAELLNGSRFNYVLLGSPADPAQLTRIVLVAKAGAEPAATPGQPAPQPGMPVVNNQMVNAAPPPEESADASETETADENADDPDAADAADQPAAGADGQSGVKTPQQMLQEMQQRQLQLQQQQQQQGQTPPVQPGPATGYPQPGAPPVPQRSPQDQ